MNKVTRVPITTPIQKTDLTNEATEEKIVAEKQTLEKSKAKDNNKAESPKTATAATGPMKVHVLVKDTPRPTKVALAVVSRSPLSVAVLKSASPSTPMFILIDTFGEELFVTSSTEITFSNMEEHYLTQKKVPLLSTII